MRAAATIAVLAAVTLIALATPTPAATFDVSIKGNAFVPPSLTIEVGDTVRWTNNDGPLIHTVTSGTPPSKSGLFDSGNMSPSGTFSFTFTQVGTVPYWCQHHPSMTATVIVKDSSPPPPPPTATISGRVTGPAAGGTLVVVQGPTTVDAVTSSSGSYRADDLPPGSYVVRPSRSGFTFSPTSRVVSLSGSSVSGIDFSSVVEPIGTDALEIGKFKLKIKTTRPDRDKLELKAVLRPVPTNQPNVDVDDIRIRIGDFYDRTFAASEVVVNSSGTKVTFADETTKLKLKLRLSATGGTITVKLSLKRSDFQTGGPVDPTDPVAITITYGDAEASATH